MMKSLLHFALRLTCRVKRQDAPVTSVLVCAASGIGDSLMALPAVNALCRALPGVPVDAIIGAPTEVLLRRHDGIRHLFVLPRMGASYLRLIWRLRKLHYSHFVAFIPSNTLRHVLIPVCARIPVRMKHRSPHGGRNNFDFLFSHVLHYGMDRHRTKLNVDLAGCLASGVDQPSQRKALSGEFHPRVTLPQSPFAVIHPGCRKDAIMKRWPAIRFAAVADFLVQEAHLEVVVVGGAEDMDDVQAVIASAQVRIHNYAAKLPLDETAGVLQGSQFLISNDSGIMHLAVALGVPVIAIFGPTEAQHIGPWGARDVVLRKGERVENVEVSDVILAAISLHRNPG